jgi:hypothetical protein
VYSRASERRTRTWLLLACPRCACCSLLQLDLVDEQSNLTGMSEVMSYQVLSEDGRGSSYIGHLPPPIERHYLAALRVLDAGVPEASAVQLRRTLEGAAASSGITGGNLVQQISQLVDQGMVTKDFGRAIHHVRKIGNQGAHFSDELLDEAKSDAL